MHTCTHTTRIYVYKYKHILIKCFDILYTLNTNTNLKKTPAAALIEKTIFFQLSTKIETPTRSIFSLPPHPPHKQIHLDTLRVFNSI